MILYMKQMVVIGAGKRVINDVIPAVLSLSGALELGAVYARTARTAEGAWGAVPVLSIDTLISEDLEKVDIIYLAVPIGSMEKVLRRLANFPLAEKTLIIDTPVPLSRRVRKYLERYRCVHVAEDSVWLPWLELFKGKKIKTIECAYSVYRYHGIALLKALLHAPVQYAYRIGKRTHAMIGQTNVMIVEPRNYSLGTLMVDGIQVQMLIEDHNCRGFLFEDISVMLSEEEQKLMGYIEKSDSIISRMLDVKRVGLRRLLAEVANGKSTWSVEEGLNDARADYFVHRFFLYFRLKRGASKEERCGVPDDTCQDARGDHSPETPHRNTRN